MADLVKVETVKTVTLSLSDDEARTLAVILSRVGGSTKLGINSDGEDSARRHSDSMNQALRVAGYEYREAPEHPLANGSIYFDNYED